MQTYQKDFARLLAESEALFFAEGLRLKDGRPTPYFINLGLFRTGRLISLMGKYMARLLVDQGVVGGMDVLLGPSYKGSALAVATAQALYHEFDLNILFEYDRKEAKTHGEASLGKSLFVTGALFDRSRVLILDDVGTTMATKYDLLKTLKAESAQRKIKLNLSGVALAVDRQQTTAVLDDRGRAREGVKGEDAIAAFMAQTGLKVFSLVGIREMIEFLAQEEIPVLIHGVKRPLDHRTVREFQKYLETYGVDRT